MLPWILCGVLLIVLVIVIGRYRGLCQGLDEIAVQFGQRLTSDTNNIICLTRGHARAKRFATQINRELLFLRKQRLEYVSGDRELKEAVTAISHDLRTPLTAISGYLELLENEEQSDAARRYWTQIAGRTEEMKNLTEELFRYSVIVSSESVKPEAVVVNKVLEESLLGCMGAMTARGMQPVIEMPALPVIRRLDPRLLGRIFDNILSNALKYSDGDLTVSLSEDGVIRFANQAKTLTPVMAERLFDRFYTVETARKSTGLGLSIAQLLTERMGGRIGADYRDGRLTVTVMFREKCER